MLLDKCFPKYTIFYIGGNIPNLPYVELHKCTTVVPASTSHVYDTLPATEAYHRLGYQGVPMMVVVLLEDLSGEVPVTPQDSIHQSHI